MHSLNIFRIVSQQSIQTPISVSQNTQLLPCLLLYVIIHSVSNLLALNAFLFFFSKLKPEELCEWPFRHLAGTKAEITRSHTRVVR